MQQTAAAVTASSSMFDDLFDADHLTHHNMLSDTNTSPRSADSPSGVGSDQENSHNLNSNAPVKNTELWSTELLRQLVQQQHNSMPLGTNGTNNHMMNNEPPTALSCHQRSGHNSPVNCASVIAPSVRGACWSPTDSGCASHTSCVASSSDTSPTGFRPTQGQSKSAFMDLPDLEVQRHTENEQNTGWGPTAPWSTAVLARSNEKTAHNPWANFYTENSDQPDCYQQMQQSAAAVDSAKRALFERNLSAQNLSNCDRSPAQQESSNTQRLSHQTQANNNNLDYRSSSARPPISSGMFTGGSGSAPYNRAVAGLLPPPPAIPPMSASHHFTQNKDFVSSVRLNQYDNSNRPFHTNMGYSQAAPIAAGSNAHYPVNFHNNVRSSRNVFTEPGTGMKDVPLWLKSLRLHKYTNLFQHLTYDQMLALNDEILEKQGVTKGARRKLVCSIEKLNARVTILRALEHDTLEAAGIRSALQELKAIIISPIRQYPVPGRPEPDQARIDGLLHVVPLHYMDMDNLPAHIVRVIGKVHMAILECAEGLLDDECYLNLLHVIDRASNHEAFTLAQKRRLAGWKQAINKLWKPKRVTCGLDRLRMHSYAGVSCAPQAYVGCWSAVHNQPVPLRVSQPTQPPMTLPPQPPIPLPPPANNTVNVMHANNNNNANSNYAPQNRAIPQSNVMFQAEHIKNNEQAGNNSKLAEQQEQLQIILHALLVQQQATGLTPAAHVLMAQALAALHLQHEQSACKRAAPSASNATQAMPPMMPNSHVHVNSNKLYGNTSQPISALPQHRPATFMHQVTDEHSLAVFLKQLNAYAQQQQMASVVKGHAQHNTNPSDGGGNGVTVSGAQTTVGASVATTNYKTPYYWNEPINTRLPPIHAFSPPEQQSCDQGRVKVSVDEVSAGLSHLVMSNKHTPTDNATATSTRYPAPQPTMTHWTNDEWSCSADEWSQPRPKESNTLTEANKHSTNINNSTWSMEHLCRSVAEVAGRDLGNTVNGNHAHINTASLLNAPHETYKQQNVFATNKIY